MTGPRHAPPSSEARRTHGVGFVCAFLFVLWLGTGLWNTVKPMPPGTHVASLPARATESEVDFIGDAQDIARRSADLIDRADEMIVLDQCPLPAFMAEHLLARKRLHPKLKIVLVIDPRSEFYGGTPAATLAAFEQTGMIVARTRLERLRDSDFLYSSAWRLGIGWWSDPYEEAQREPTLLATLRHANDKTDSRRVLVADDGAGGWSSIVASAGRSALLLRGRLARDIAASELAIAAWSTDDDRLPEPPPAQLKTAGSLDARFLSEGAILAALCDTVAGVGAGDTIDIAADVLTERRIIDALLHAAARGAHLRLLLDPARRDNLSVAGELLHRGGAVIDVRWNRSAGAPLIAIREHDDLWLYLGSAALTRRNLDDLNLEATVELRMPIGAAVAHAAAASFERSWIPAARYGKHVDESTDSYWRYRLTEATGVPLSF